MVAIAFRRMATTILEVAALASPCIEQRPKAIDLNEEARKLDSLKAKRKQLARQAEAVIAQCKAQYPE